MDRALVGICLVTKQPELVVIVIIAELTMRKSAKLTVGSPLKNGKCDCLPPLTNWCTFDLWCVNCDGKSRYHVPRSWLNPTGNLAVVFEEWGGDPTGITMLKRSVSSVCANVSEWQPSMSNWHTRDYGKPKVRLFCNPDQRISAIKFASFGTPQGVCGSFSEGSCHGHKSYDAFEKVNFPTCCY